LEADPYGEKSFSRNGYKLKEGAAAKQDSGKAYLYMKCTDEFAQFAKEKLTGLATPCNPEVTAAVSKVIEDEESNAEMGFGAIFGE
jgi:hypothetical protein